MYIFTSNVEPVLKISYPRTDAEWQAYFELRWQVLRAPWNQPCGSERDSLEAASEHVMVLSEEKLLLGIGRVHFTEEGNAQIRYMAVSEDARGKGVGTLLLKELENIARLHGAGVVRLDARETALGFYRRLGYVDMGEGHTLYGTIRHRKMRKSLAATV